MENEFNHLVLQGLLSKMSSSSLFLSHFFSRSLSVSSLSISCSISFLLPSFLPKDVKVSSSCSRTRTFSEEVLQILWFFSFPSFLSYFFLSSSSSPLLPLVFVGFKLQFFLHPFSLLSLRLLLFLSLFHSVHFSFSNFFLPGGFFDPNPFADFFYLILCFSLSFLFISLSLTSWILTMTCSVLWIHLGNDKVRTRKYYLLSFSFFLSLHPSFHSWFWKGRGSSRKKFEERDERDEREWEEKRSAGHLKGYSFLLGHAGLNFLTIEGTLVHFMWSSLSREWWHEIILFLFHSLFFLFHSLSSLFLSFWHSMRTNRQWIETWLERKTKSFLSLMGKMRKQLMIFDCFQEQLLLISFLSLSLAIISCFGYTHFNYTF